MARKKAVETKKTKVKVEKETLTAKAPKVAVPDFKMPSRKYMYMGLAALLLVLAVAAAYKFLVIAWVDGKPITRMAFYGQLEKRYGAETKDQLIAETLIESESKKRKVSVSDQEVEAEYKKLEEQFGGAENIQLTLEQQGITLEDFRKQLRLQTLIKKMFSDVNISDQDIATYIETNKEQFADATDEAKLKAEVKEQLASQKLSQSFSEWLQTNLQSNRVSRQ